jgi:polysaccharide export outer membrane protein
MDLRAPKPERRVECWRRAVLTAIALLLVASCSHRGRFVWGETLVAVPEPDTSYRIANGDVIGVRVWNQESVSIPRVRVRDDGHISMPLIRDVEVAGLAPEEVARQMEAKLKEFVVNPIVTVSVEESRPLRISVVGEVTRPGVYDLERSAGVLHALAAGGGLTPYAASDGVFVLRPLRDGGVSRIRFRYEALARGGLSAAFQLRHGDVVIVER